MSKLENLPMLEDADDYQDWRIQFEAFLKCGVEDTQHTAVLVRCLSRSILRDLRARIHPVNVLEKAHTELLTILDSMFKVEKLELARKAHLFELKQKGKSLDDFMSECRREANDCDWTNFDADKAAILTFVIGIDDVAIRKHLLLHSDGKSSTDLLSAAKIVLASTQEAAAFSKRREIANAVLSPKNARNRSPSRSRRELKCYSCNGNHYRNDCPHRNECSKCGKFGHIQAACGQIFHHRPRSKTPSHSRSQGRATTIQGTVKTARILDAGLIPPILIPFVIQGKKIQLEYDPGSPVTIIDAYSWKLIGKPHLVPSNFDLSSITGDPLDIMGQFTANAKFLNQEKVLQVLVHRSPTKVVGRDWVRSFGQPLISHATELLLPYNDSNGVYKVQTSLQRVLSRHVEIFEPGLGHCSRVKAKLHLKENAQPVYRKAWNVPFALKEKVDAEYDRLEALGVIEKLTQSGQHQCTGLNKQLELQQHPIPTITELFQKLNGGKKFTKIDLSDAYFQIELDEDSKRLVVINTHRGLYKYNRLPFGIASASAIFQELMDQMLTGTPNAAAYLDDIIVTGKNDAEHLEALSKVLERIRDYGLKIGKDKCKFMQDSVEYLGFIVDANGIRTSPEKIRAIVDMPPPKNIHQIRSFCGMVNHYQRFVPNLSTLRKPLDYLTKKEVKFNWGREQANAFEKIKEVLQSPLLLTYYQPEVPLFMAADASKDGIGAVLFHRFPNGTEKAIAHVSKTLTKSEQNYAQIEKEAYAIVYGFNKFHQYLWANHFTLLTDHKPLVTIFGSQKGIPQTAASRLQRWALILMGYSFNIEYVNTKNFGQADGLSRLPLDSDQQFEETEAESEKFHIANIHSTQAELPVDVKQIARETTKDPILMQILKWIQGSWPEKVRGSDFQAYVCKKDSLSLVNGCILWQDRTVIPYMLRQKVLKTQSL
uniref:RNA-directed DNA polymerase n=1 Tax=Acrobeloides nanus TaxID=290746 RepID=A0A914E5V9_9BILA